MFKNSILGFLIVSVSLFNSGFVNGQGLEKCDEVQSSFKGVFTNSSASKPAAKKIEGNLPKVGQKGEILVAFEKELFGALVTGDLLIATAEVTRVSRQTIQFKVIEEYSQMTVNGKKKNHFIKNKEITFNVYDYDQPHEEIIKNEAGKIIAKGQFFCGQKRGVWDHYYENGRLFQRYEVNAENKIIGEYVAFHENGKRSMLLNYKEGKPVGPYVRYYENGSVKEKGTYDEEGKTTGEVFTYFETGSMESKKHLETGEYEEYYKNGQLKLKGFYSPNGQKEKKWESWFKDGNQRFVIHYKDGVEVGDYEVWYPNGKFRERRKYDQMGLKTGEWLNYQENGALYEKVNYENDRQNGVYQKYFQSGVLEVDCVYRNDTIHGLYKAYSEQGNLFEEGVYKAGLKEGIWKRFFETGDVQISQLFKNDLPAGPFEVYGAPGKIIEKGNRVGVHMVGEFIRYSEKGHVIETGTFNEEGQRDGSWKFYNEDKQLMAKGKFVNGVKKGKWIERNKEGKKEKRHYK